MLTLLIPVKPLTTAKSRLRGAVPEPRHAELVLAMLRDTVCAALAARTAPRIVVVSVDPTVAAALRHEDVRVLDDEPGPDLNTALCHAAATIRGPVGVLQADLPALRTADLDAAVTEAAGARAYCADRHATGTTLLLAGPGRLRPAFGPHSARAHRAGGALEVATGADSLRCDVDTWADLTVARDLGPGRWTSRVLHHIPHRQERRISR